jgi:hypothetical protein
MPSFTYSRQLANFEAGQVEDHGCALPREILDVFDFFEWPTQVDEANRLQQCSPTLSVKNIDADSELGLAAVGDSKDFAFLTFYFYRGIRKSFFGLMKRPAVLSTPEVELPLAAARQLLESFLSGNHDSVLNSLESAA